MIHKRILILGAGPAGLSIANRLQQMGARDFLVLEKETEAGGLCRSAEVDGSPFDIGGGHFLDVRRPKVNEFLFGFMPEEEWDRYDRDSRIAVNGNMVGHPIEANIWQMQIDDQVEYLKSIATAGCNRGEEMPEEFVDWIYWKLGDKIADDYMIPYNQKIFYKDLNELGTYWLEKLPNVSFEETLRSCLEKKAYGTQPGHAQFYYPKKYGYGELWLRMAAALGDKIRCNSNVTEFDMEAKTVKLEDGSCYQADLIVTTIPWRSIGKIMGMPEGILSDVEQLKHSSVETRYYEKNLNTEAQWIYYPDPKLAYHRILVRHNFCPDSKGYWTETNSERVTLIPESEQANFHYMNEYAYPLNTVGKPEKMERLITWAKERDIYPLGRWGEHQHYNSDVTVEKAMEMAEVLQKKVLS